MNKLLIAATGALVAFAPISAQASTRNTVIATTAVMYCNYQMGHMTIREASEFGTNYLLNQGISDSVANNIMDSSTFNDEVISAIEVGGGCEKITTK